MMQQFEIWLIQAWAPVNSDSKSITKTQAGQQYFSTKNYFSGTSCFLLCLPLTKYCNTSLILYHKNVVLLEIFINIYAYNKVEFDTRQDFIYLTSTFIK